MLKGEYKVVCSKEKFGNKIYIDIVPANGVIHDQIFFSRQQLNKLYNNTPLEKYNYSIMLKTDDKNNPQILFPEPLGVNKSCELYRSIKRDYEILESLIIKAYENMINSGQNSTLRLYSIVEMNAIEDSKYNSDWELFEKRRRQKVGNTHNVAHTISFAEKHTHKTAPQTLQEENMEKIYQEQEDISNRRVLCEYKRSQSPLAAWQRFQNEYSGD